MKKGNKFLGTSIGLILIILLISYISYANKRDNTTVDTLILKAENCNIVVQKSENNSFQYDYDKKLFEFITKTEQNKLTIIANPKDNAKITWLNKIIISIPNNLTFKKVNVQNYKAGIDLCEINSEINIVNNEGATSFYIPKQLNHNITYTSNKGSGTVTLYNETNNYKFNLFEEKSSTSIPFSDYHPNSSTYTYVKGDGSSHVNINLKESSFAVNIAKELIQTKLTFKYMEELGIHSPSIDKNTLPDSMRDCKFYNMLNIDENTPINSIIQSYITGKQNKYDYDYIPLEDEAYFGIYEKSLILLFDKNKQLLGYADIPKINAGVVYVHLSKYNQSN